MLSPLDRVIAKQHFFHINNIIFSHIYWETWKYLGLLFCCTICGPMYFLLPKSVYLCSRGGLVWAATALSPHLWGTPFTPMCDPGNPFPSSHYLPISVLGVVGNFSGVSPHLLQPFSHASKALTPCHGPPQKRVSHRPCPQGACSPAGSQDKDQRRTTKTTQHEDLSFNLQVGITW